MSKVYSIYDSKAEAYMQPFYAETAGLALRTFSNAANSPDSVIGKYPSDFILFEVATFDDKTGSFDSYKQPKNLGLAVEYVENA